MCRRRGPGAASAGVHGSVARVTASGWWRLVAVSVALGGCRGGGAGQPCEQLSACPGALVCQVGRCSAVEAVPVAAEARRRVLEPVDSRFVDRLTTEGEASEVRLGSQAGGGALLLLRFEPSEVGGAPRRAFLVLTPVDEAPGDSGTIEVEVSPIVEPWRSGDRGALPRLGAPLARARWTLSPPRAARIDVTELVRGWLEQPGATHGMALRAFHGEALGGRFGLDGAAGVGPRLDVYLP